MIARCGKESGGPTLVAVVVGLLLGFGVGLPTASAAPTTADFDHVCSYDQSVPQCASTPDRANVDAEGVFHVLVSELSGNRECGTLRAPAVGVATEAVPVLKGPIADAVPSSLAEQLALQEARASGGSQIMANLADEPRLIANYGEGEWVKMQSVLRGEQGNINVHWFKNLTSGLEVEFTFK